MFFFFFPIKNIITFFFFFSSRRRHTRLTCDWSSDVCSSDLPEVRDLQHLRLVLEAREAVAAEEPLRRVEAVAAVARLEEVRRAAVEVEVPPGGLVDVERVVEVPDRVRRVGDLQDEVGERLHLRAGERTAAAEESVEGDVE